MLYDIGIVWFYMDGIYVVNLKFTVVATRGTSRNKKKKCGLKLLSPSLSFSLVHTIFIYL